MRKMTIEQIENRYHKGYGRGEGQHYRPWLDIHDFSSRGKSYRMAGRKTNRSQTFFSIGEKNRFLAEQFRDDVVDIREQFPLWPLSETLDIAETLGVKHPAPHGEPVVMTTDLVLTRSDGTLEAISVKRAKDLHDERVLEDLEIERTYWQRRGDFKISTELEVPEALAANLAWIDSRYEASALGLGATPVPVVSAALFSELSEDPDRALRDACLATDDRLGLSAGDSLSVFAHMLAHKVWAAPLLTKIDPSKPVGVVRLNERTLEAA